MPRPVLHGDVDVEELANPLMLRHGGETLIEHVLEGVLICADEAAAPKVRPPVVHHLNEQ